MSENPSRPGASQNIYGTRFAAIMAAVLVATALFQDYSSEDLPRVAENTATDPRPKPVHPLVQLANREPDLKQQLLDRIEPQARQPESGFEPGPLRLDTSRLAKWVQKEQYPLARHYLIRQASAAVDRNDKRALGRIIQLLARVSATQGDLASTEVYLFEALDIFEQTGDSGQIADTQLLIGQMYARRRQVAQQAGWAYGELLMARFYLSKGQGYQARESLDRTIHHNLKLGRTGAAASAYKTLARYYRTVGDTAGANGAMMNAARYYAHSGQELHAREVVDSLKAGQASLNLIENLESDIENRLARYESQITLVRQARDYMQLYSLYKSKGENGRAWEFRVKASEILSRTSKRDMYFRAPDVMALLYDSNYNITRASNYYDKAGEIYLGQSNDDAYEKAMSLKAAVN